METPQAPHVSVTGRIVVEGQLSGSGNPARSEDAPAMQWSWRFWKGRPETILARTSVITAIANILLAAGTIGLALVTLSQLHAFDRESRVRLRSYVSVVATHSPMVAGQPVNFPVVVQATGQTPAFDVIAQRGGARAMPYPLPPRTQFREQEIVNFENLPNKVSLSPGNTVSILNATDPITQSIYNTIMTQKTERVYTWGRVTYHDVFGCRRWLNYCFVSNDTPDQTDICVQHNDPEGEPGACPK